MRALENKIKRLIQTQGPLSIDRFMQMVLQDPEHGYYIKQDPLGQDGDFITAPEISQIFGEMLGLWAGEFTLRNPVNCFHLVELGPGRGTLMSDMVRVITSSPALASLAHDLNIHFVETSPALRQAQKSAIEVLNIDAIWHDDTSTLPNAPCLIIANEFFDALPIRQFVRHGDGWQERLVGIDKEQLVFKNQKTKESMAFNSNIADISEGDIVEVAPACELVMKQLCQHIVRFGGALLAIDYGYTRPAAGDSFQALYKHEFVSPLSHIGNADLTAHVNFAGLANIAHMSGLRTHGPVTQGHFLTQLGAESRLQQILQKAPQHHQSQITDGYQRLIAPEAMGQLFKVLAVTKPPSATPEGFARA